MKVTVEKYPPPAPPVTYTVILEGMSESEAKKLFLILGEELNRNRAITGKDRHSGNEAQRDAIAMTIRNALYAKGIE